MFYIGCPMWGYKEWVGSGKLFPPRTPASDFLRLYSRKLSTVEGNTIFYALSFGRNNCTLGTRHSTNVSLLSQSPAQH